MKTKVTKREAVILDSMSGRLWYTPENLNTTGQLLRKLVLSGLVIQDGLRYRRVSKSYTVRSVNEATKAMLGKKYGRLTVTAVEPKKTQDNYAYVTCECGNEFRTDAAKLRRGAVTQCRPCGDYKPDDHVEFNRLWLSRAIV